MAPIDDGELQVHVLDMIEGGATDADIIRATAGRVTLGQIRELRAATQPPGAVVVAAAHTPQRRGDRLRCICGAFASEHGDGGSGVCARTLCRTFQEQT